MSSARVVITGLGAITPLGLTVGEMWASLCAGRNGIGRITAFDPVGFSCQLAGQVPEYKIQNYVPKSFRKASPSVDALTILSLYASTTSLSCGSGLLEATR